MKELTFQIKRYSIMYWYRFFNRFEFLKNTKFKFILWWYNKYPEKYCWADCVGWAFSPSRWNPFKIDGTKGCYLDSMDAGQFESCYCGGWHKGQCGATLSKEEQDKILEQRETELYERHKDELPF